MGFLLKRMPKAAKDKISAEIEAEAAKAASELMTDSDVVPVLAIIPQKGLSVHLQ